MPGDRPVRHPDRIECMQRLPAQWLRLADRAGHHELVFVSPGLVVGGRVGNEGGRRGGGTGGGRGQGGERRGGSGGGGEAGGREGDIVG